ncbi:MAG: hypothetical protein KatS3mg115_2023 [Candidatus Poribacteria bacterium]|nr:MAG: hypothetical protein KatS3mg115_2023 [Candidatus Poribacteria bacterium]
MPPRRVPQLSEEELLQLWTQPELIRWPVRTLEGLEVRLLDSGVVNRFDGPDLLDCSLLIGGRPVRGPIELHLRTGDWYTHGHHQNPAYERVALHVVWEDDGTGLRVRTQSGRRVSVVELWRQLRVPAGLIRRFLVSRPPGRCPLPTPSPDEQQERRSQLERLGEARLLRKAAQLREEARQKGWEETLYLRLADAMGYSQNRGPFARLAHGLPLPYLRGLPDEAIGPILLGCAGFLEEAPGPLASRYRQFWQDHWQGPPLLRREEWNVGKVRAANHPLRRALALGALVRRGSLVQWALTALAQRGQRARLEAVTVPAEGYWRTHVDFEVSTRRPLPHLLGTQRAQDIWLNLLLPFAFAYEEDSERSSLREDAWRLLQTVPASGANSKTDWVERHVLGGTRSGRGVAQQGAIELFDRWCHPRRCGCCPLSASSLRPALRTAESL